MVTAVNTKKRFLVLAWFLMLVCIVDASSKATGHAVTWQKTFGGNGVDGGHSVQQTSDGGYIIAGVTTSFGDKEEDVYLIKTDSKGKQLWEKTFEGTDDYGPYVHDDYARSVQQTFDGGYIIAGYTYSYPSGYDVCLIKTDSNGEKLWGKTFGGSNYDYGESVRETSDRGYIIAGETDSYGAGSHDIYLIKTDSKGEKLWEKTFGGRDHDYVGSVQQTLDGGYIIVGGVTFVDVCLIKTNADGEKLWEKTFGGDDWDSGYSVQETSDGGYIIAGSTISYGAGSFDFYLIKTDSDGEKLWEKTFGGTGDDQGKSVQQTSDGGYLITGSTNSYGAGSYDVYLIKTDSEGQLSVPPEDISDYISGIYFERIRDYGDPTDNTDLMYEFYLEIYAYDDKAINMDADVNSVTVLTPAGFTFQIPEQAGQWSDGVWTSYEYSSDDWGGEAIWEYRARSEDLANLHTYGDGEYTITVHYNDGNQSQTKAWFGIPDTNDPMPQPIQEPVLIFPLSNQKVASPISFLWEGCTDSNTTNLRINLEEQVTGTSKSHAFDVDETSWNLVNLTDGVWGIYLIFYHVTSSYNNDEIDIGVVKSSRSKYEFTVVSCPYPTSAYEVWGGNTWIESPGGDYATIADLENSGYVRLGAPQRQTATFWGEYQYYLIATKWQFLLDSIKGSNGSYYSSFEANSGWLNTSNEDYLLGPADGLCATVGNNMLWEDNDYSGYIVFTNPSNWIGLTVIVKSLNLNKRIINPPEELENIGPGDTIGYRISFDSSDFTNNVADVTVVDILPGEVSLVSADSNEVPGFYDPVTHTYRWSLPSLAPKSAIETELTVRVNPNVAPGTTVTNYVTVNTNETPPTTATADIVVRDEPLPPLQVQSMRIVPNIISRSGGTYDVQAILILPPGIGKKQVRDDDVLPTLYWGQDKKISANRQLVYGTDTSAKVIAIFDKAELVNLISEDGEVAVKVVGELITGQSWYGEASVYIAK